ncbi:hypothetical protein COCVIDRAFT_116888, partial [Bipolaris victoriae FI3]
IYPVFYKKLLELAPLDTKLVTNIELKDNKYKVKKIKNLRKISKNLINYKLLVRKYY